MLLPVSTDTETVYLWLFLPFGHAFCSSSHLDSPQPVKSHPPDLHLPPTSPRHGSNRHAQTPQQHRPHDLTRPPRHPTAIATAAPPAPTLPTNLSTTTDAPAATAKPNLLPVCIAESISDPTNPLPCGPWTAANSTEYKDFMYCMTDLAFCKGGDLERSRVVKGCELHPDLPACKGPNDGDGGVGIQGDNPIGDLITRFRCLVDHTLPECKALGIKAEGCVVPEEIDVGGPGKRSVELEEEEEKEMGTHQLSKHGEKSTDLLRWFYCMDR